MSNISEITKEFKSLFGAGITSDMPCLVGQPTSNSYELYSPHLKVTIVIAVNAAIIEDLVTNYRAVRETQHLRELASDAITLMIHSTGKSAGEIPMMIVPMTSWNRIGRESKGVAKMIYDKLDALIRIGACEARSRLVDHAVRRVETESMWDE